jgi:hypothetical protein
LAAVGGASLSAAHLSVLADLSNPKAVLQGLQQAHLLESAPLQAEGERYLLAGNVTRTLQASIDLSTWQEHALGYFVGWLQTEHPSDEVILEERQALLSLLRWAVGEHSWPEAAILAQALDAPLALAGRWNLWKEELQLALPVAEALDEPGLQAWVYHQLGTRALCLGESSEGRDSLIRALRLRDSAGDRVGAVITRQNLSLLLGPLRIPRPVPLLQAEPPAEANLQLAPSQPAVQPRAVEPANPPPVFLPLPVESSAAGVWRQTLNPLLLVLAILMTLALMGVVVMLVYLVWTGSFPLNLKEPTAIANQAASATYPLPGSVLFPTPVTAQPAITLQTAVILPTINVDGDTCVTPSGWQAFTARPGDSLNSLAAATGSSTLELVLANCMLNSGQTVQPGMVVYLPRAPTWPSVTLSPTVTLTPNATPTQTAIAASATVTLTPVPAGQNMADLALTGWEVKNYASVDTQGNLLIPVRMTITNQGKAEANDFAIIIYELEGNASASQLAIGGVGQTLVFNLAGGASSNSLLIIQALAPGTTQAFDGNIVLGPALQGRTITLWAAVDACDPNEGGPRYCSIQESNESNNLSAPFPASIPVMPTPVATSASPAAAQPTSPALTAEATASGLLIPVTGGQCVDFDDLDPAAVYEGSDSFLANSVTFGIGPLTLRGGSIPADGFAASSSEGRAGGMGKELRITDAVVEVLLGNGTSSLSVRYAHFTGEVNLEINGSLAALASLVDVQGKTIAGVSISVIQQPDQGIGQLGLSGPIRSFSAGGQELWLDDLCFR